MPKILRRCAPFVIALCASGCIDRTRVNANCDWTRDADFPLDLTKPADHQHLVADAQLAEELAVRRADAEHKRRFGYEGHGGLVDYGRVLHECFGALADRIAHDHAVTAADIDAARPERSAAFDFVVAAPFVLFYLAAAAAVGTFIRRSFADARPLVLSGVFAFAAAGSSALGVQLGAVWSAIWETVRIGNDHFGSFRATRPFWGQHVGLLFVGGMLAFWGVCLLLPRRPVSRAHATTRVMLS